MNTATLHVLHDGQDGSDNAPTCPKPSFNSTSHKLGSRAKKTPVADRPEVFPRGTAYGYLSSRHSSLYSEGHISFTPDFALNILTMDRNILLHPHVLDLVLTHLPQSDLLLAQRVCKTWQTTIQTSSALQKTLFFKPDYRSRPSDDIQINGLLLHHFQGFFLNQVSRRDRAHSVFGQTRWHQQAVRAHPDPRILNAYARKEASWRRMLPYRPAQRQLQVIREDERTLNDTGIYLSIIFGDEGPAHAAHSMNVTFGLVYDIVQSHVFPSHLNRGGVGAKMDIISESSGPRSCCGPEGLSVRTTIPREQPSLRIYADLLCASDFAAPGSLILRLWAFSGCCVHTGPMHYPDDYLKSEGAVLDLMNDVAWTSTEKFFHAPEECG